MSKRIKTKKELYNICIERLRENQYAIDVYSTDNPDLSDNERLKNRERFAAAKATNDFIENILTGNYLSAIHKEAKGISVETETPDQKLIRNMLEVYVRFLISHVPLNPLTDVEKHITDEIKSGEYKALHSIIAFFKSQTNGCLERVLNGWNKVFIPEFWEQGGKMQYGWDTTKYFSLYQIERKKIYIYKHLQHHLKTDKKLSEREKRHDRIRALQNGQIDPHYLIGFERKDNG